MNIIKTCEFCGAQFEVPNNKHGLRKRFCNTSCSAKWRNQSYGPTVISEDARKKNAEVLHNRWNNEEFRKKKTEYMKTNNPMHIPGVIEKVKQTRLKNGSYTNNFKYGNGKISEYENKVYDILISNGFYYNYAISTKLARDAFPYEKFAYSYKPDFVNLVTKVCIEIDGNNHNKNNQKIKSPFKQ